MMGDSHTFEYFILFELAGATYGIRSSNVSQVEMLDRVTPVPDGPPYLEGVVLSRGKVIPAINLRTRFGFQEVQFNFRTRLIVVQVADRTVGLIVDTAREFISLDTATIIPPPEDITGLSGEYLQGIAKVGERLILILAVEEVLRLSENVGFLAEDDQLSRADVS